MMRNKPSSSLQKTYDECYLICSTAVYFEGQGNEAEALRSWRSALDQIYYHNAYRVPSGYRPRSETEQALKDSLRDMENQCKERVDLLEALKLSRQEKQAGEVGGASSAEESNGRIRKSSARPPRATSELEMGRKEKGFIGDGTIPAVSYPDLSRPGPPLPQRPPMVMKNISERAVVGSKAYSSPSSSHSGAAPNARSGSGNPVYTPTLAPPMKKTSRSPSPDKRSMLHTLRSGDRASRKSLPKQKASTRREDSVTSKAASLAWQHQQSSMGKSGRDRLGRSFDEDANNSSMTLSGGARIPSNSDPTNSRPDSSANMRYDSKTRTMVEDRLELSLRDIPGEEIHNSSRLGSCQFPSTDQGRSSSFSGVSQFDQFHESQNPAIEKRVLPLPSSHSRYGTKLDPLSYPTYLKEYPETSAKILSSKELPVRRKPVHAEGEGSFSRLSRGSAAANISSPRRDRYREKDDARQAQRKGIHEHRDDDTSSISVDDDTNSSGGQASKPKRKSKAKAKPREPAVLADPTTPTSDTEGSETDQVKSAWDAKVRSLMKNLPKGIDEGAAKQIFNEIVVQGDEVHWEDVAGLEIAKKALKEAVVYPFLRPDLFMGLREPARGMLLFGPPGTGKTMLARAVATESRSTFFSISASSLTSKYLGESEKLVRALFSLAKALAPSIIFVDEIDSLLSSRSGSGEHEATRRIKTEFLIQWSDLQRAAAGREQSEKEKERGDASRVLVLAATNLPWAIDEAARRRFVRRQYIPLPEDGTRAVQLKTLLGHQKHGLEEADIERLVELTDGFSGSDITALAKDAAMGPLRSLGEKLLEMSMDQIRPIQFEDFEASLVNIRPSVSKQGLKEFEDWAREFGERGG